MQLSRLIGPELEALLQDRPEEARPLLAQLHPEDLADLASCMPLLRATGLLRLLPPHYAAQVLARLEPQQQRSLAAILGAPSVARLAQEMDADDRVDFLAELPSDDATAVLQELQGIAPLAAQSVRELSQWPEWTAGGLMTTDYWAVSSNQTVADAIEEIRKHTTKSEVADQVFVVDGEHHLVGTVSLRDLVLHAGNTPLAGITHLHIITCPPDAYQEEVALQMGKYDLAAMPVIAGNGRLLGVITHDDIIDVLEEEQDEDVQKMGAVEPLEDGYLHVGFGTFLRKRAPWLVVLFLGGFFTTALLSRFDGTLSRVAQLSFYVPLLLSAGGNSGTQSAALIIRGLAAGDLGPKDWSAVLRREASQGFALGLLLAILGASRAAIGGEGPLFVVLIFASVAAIVLLGCLIGAAVPILLHRWRADPAASSSPFIASAVDLLGLLLYLSLAQWIVGGP